MSENQELSTKQDPNLDWLLAAVVDLVNKLPITIGVTLNVGGLVISGQMIGVEDYFEELAKLMATPKVNETLNQGLQQLFEQLSSARTLLNEKKKGDVEEVQKQPTFIHLKDVKMLLSNRQAIPDNSGSLWRGRLSQVDGFVFGTLSNTI
jgi:hypothetical protein